MNFVTTRCPKTQLLFLDALTKSLYPLIKILARCLITHTHFCMITKLVEYEADISQCFLFPFPFADVHRFQECVKSGSTCYGTFFF